MSSLDYNTLFDLLTFQFQLENVFFLLAFKSYHLSYHNHYNMYTLIQSRIVSHIEALEGDLSFALAKTIFQIPSNAHNFLI